MKKKSLKLNYFYNLSMLLLNLLFPLITAPYISGILGANNIGKVNYANAISNWFILVASFGIPTFGIREIAKNRDNKTNLSKTFWDLIIIKAIFSVIALVIYTAIILLNKAFREEVMLYLVMSIAIFLNIFSIDWFYQGVEEYGYITLRNLIIKLVSLILIFVSVKNRNDYVIYALISIFALTFSNILNYINVKKYVYLNISKVDFKYYFLNLKIFFVSSLIISIYSQLDQIILGAISDKKSLAYYVRSRQIVNIGISLTNAFSTVLIPKVSYLFRENYSEYKKLLQKSINYIYLIALPTTVGLFMLSKEVSYLFGGNEFLPASKSLFLTSFLVVIVSLGTWQYNQIFLPAGNEKFGLKIQCFVAIINVVFNIILIPKFSYIGTCIAILCAELFGTIIGSFYVKLKYKELKIQYITNSFIIYLISSIIMGIFILFIQSFDNKYYMNLLLSLIFSPLIYGISTIIFRDNISIEIIKVTLKKIKG